jgi:hypothetical protein
MKTVTNPEELAGEELNGVCFVMDYVEFHFNGPVLRALAGVTVRARAQEAAFPGIGACAVLCELIGAVVREVVIRDGQDIVLSFIDGEELRISLLEEDRLGPEAAHFTPGPTGPIQVW